jgi:hypothetical protein
MDCPRCMRCRLSRCSVSWSSSQGVDSWAGPCSVGLVAAAATGTVSIGSVEVAIKRGSSSGRPQAGAITEARQMLRAARKAI